MTEEPRIRFVCTGGKSQHKDTILTTCIVHDDWLEWTRLYSSHDAERRRTKVSCPRCSRTWTFRDERLEASILAAIERGVSRVDLSVTR